MATQPPEKIIAGCEKKILKAFYRAAKNVPFYKKLLDEKRIRPETIISLKQFTQNVPVIDKETVFPVNSLTDICYEGFLDDVCLIYSSSGSSKVFSFGVETWENRENLAVGLEFLLDNAFRIFDKKTFLINCLPMGVKVFTRTIPVAETSVREDVIIALILKLKDEFDQFILVGESPFLKKVVEEGIKASVPWKDLCVNCITGGEYISETYRTYMSTLLGIEKGKPESGIFIVNMGLSELSLSIFSENVETINIRQAAIHNDQLRRSLAGKEERRVAPLIMQYFPQQTWLETLPDENGNPELIVSMLHPKSKIPLIRYNTGDQVKLMSYLEMEKILNKYGVGGLLPTLKLPFGIISGKKLSVIDKQNKEVSVTEIKEALYDKIDVAGKITGNFRLLTDNGKILLWVQLKSEVENCNGLREQISDSISKYTSGLIAVELYPYDRFPYGVEHNFERKNQYV
ncbi:hypothetical protein [uncultured Desulfobacter sp.]|uniref:hypothetical protein n=1 Tax=uncultured Desulfobacter sp. TaxID=240139 RepID=UPI0029C62B83|nr:hypothetical protein [uncultured Desulfobacter sp.]